MKIKSNIAYHCATKELAEQFLKDAKEQGIDTHFFKQNHIVGDNYTYRIDEDNNLFFSMAKNKTSEYTGSDTNINVDDKVETAWVIQRDDGKFYYDWDFDEYCSCKAYFTNSIFKTILNKRIYSENDVAYKEIKQMELNNCKPVKIKLEVVEE